MDELEKLKTVKIKPKSIDALRLLYLIRQALNTTHLYLKPKYTLRYKKALQEVECIYIPEEIQDISSELIVEFTDISEPHDFFQILDYLSENSYPVRFHSHSLSLSELDSLKEFIQEKNRKINITPTKIEII